MVSNSNWYWWQDHNSINTDTTKGEFLTLDTSQEVSSSQRNRNWHQWQDNNNTEYRHRQHKVRVSHLGQQQHSISTQTAQRESFSLGIHCRKSACPSQTARTDNNNRTTTTTQSIYTDSTKGEFLTWDNNTEYWHRQHKGSFSLGTATTQYIYTDGTKGEFLTRDSNNIVYLHRWHKGEFLTWDTNNTEYRHRQHKGWVSHLGQQQQSINTDSTKESFSLGTTTTEYRHRQHKGWVSHLGQQQQSIDTDSTKESFSLGTHRRKSALPSQTARSQWQDQMGWSLSAQLHPETWTAAD